MRWNTPGATGILTLRCHRANNRWDQIWPHLNNQTSPTTSRRPYPTWPHPQPDRADHQDRDANLQI